MSDARTIAPAVGCRLVRESGGERLWECHDPVTVVRLLRELSESDPKLPAVRTLARQIRAQVGLSAEAYAREVHVYVRARIKWVREKIETFQSAAVTLKRRFGDCDDHARLIFALLRAGGVPARLVVMDRDGVPAHAVTQAMIEGRRWVWLETSVPAAFGEAPLAAAGRLGLHTRLNMPPGVSGVGGIEAVSWTREAGLTVGPGLSDLVMTAAVGAAVLSPLGSAVGLVAGVLGPWGASTGAGVGGGVGAIAGAVAGGMFAVQARRAAQSAQ